MKKLGILAIAMMFALFAASCGDGDTLDTDTEAGDTGSGDSDSDTDTDTDTDSDSDSDTDTDTGNVDPCDPNPCTAEHKTVCTASAGEAKCGCDVGYIAGNEGCRALVISWAQTQYPLEYSGSKGSTETFYGRVLVEGLTDLTIGLSEAVDGLTAQFGIKKESDSGYTWQNASVNAAIREDFGKNDEYMISYTFTEAGSFTYKFRFSVDNGANWTETDNSGTAHISE